LTGFLENGKREKLGAAMKKVSEKRFFEVLAQRNQAIAELEISRAAEMAAKDRLEATSEELIVARRRIRQLEENR
jgi:hypothetical protein